MNLSEGLPEIYGDSRNEEGQYREKELSTSPLGPMEPDVLTEQSAIGYTGAKFVMLFVVISFVLIRLLDLVIGLLDLVIGWLMPIIAPVFRFMFLLFGLIVIARFAMSSQYMT